MDLDTPCDLCRSFRRALSNPRNQGELLEMIKQEYEKHKKNERH